MSDVFEHSDAAYALGALDADEAAEYERHLLTCPECRQRVADARQTVELLAVADAGAFSDTGPGPVPDTLLPALLRRARRERTRRNILAGSLAAVAAACLVALVVLIWPASTKPSGPAPRAFVPVKPSAVVATAQLVDKAWGTEIDVHCKYGTDVDAPHPYLLQVIDTSNVAHGAGGWTMQPGKSVSFTGGTAVRRDRIAEVQVTLSDGTPILQLTL